MASSHIQDGKWSWLVCLSATMSWFAAMGIVFSFGIFFPVFMDYFQESRQKTGMNLFKLTFWPRRLCFSQGPPYPSPEWERGGGGCRVLDSLWFRISFSCLPFVIKIIEKSQHLLFIHPSTYLSFYWVFRKSCECTALDPEMILYMRMMQNICLFMIMPIWPWDINVFNLITMYNLKKRVTGNLIKSWK